MKKPEKPKEQLPKNFGGIKENFSDDKQATGYQPDVPDILGGANLNYILDTAGKKDEYHDGISDFINGIPIDNTITVNSNNELVYEDLTEIVKCENVPENPPATVKKILKTRTGEYIDPYSNKNKGQGYQLFDLKYSDHLLEGDKAMGWALCGTYTLTTDVEFYQTCLAEKEAAGEPKQIEVENGYAFTGYENANGHIYYDISEKANVDQIFNVTGSAWFYGIDTETQRIFLPRNNNFTQNTIDTNKVGNFVEHGLPSHTHTVYTTGTATTGKSGTAYTANTGEVLTTADALGTSEPDNNIYGNSDTVQPRSVKQLCYMCVGNTIYNEEKVDFEKLEGDVRALATQYSNIHLDRNIGEIVPSLLPLVDAGLHLLDGSVIVGGGIYGQFVDYIKKIYEGDPGSYFCTQEEWDASIQKYGVCGKFVYSAKDNAVRLPKLGNQIYTTALNGKADVDGIAYVRNATGYVTLPTTPNLINGTYSATKNWNLFARDGSGTVEYSGNSANNGTQWGIVGFADLSSAKSLTECYYYIVIATSTKTDVQVEMDKVATELVNKANVSAKNFNAEGTTYLSGLGMPSNRYIDLALGASGTTYTAPANGWVYFKKYLGYDWYYVSLTNMSSNIENQHVGHHSSYMSVLMYAHKGDTILVSYNATGETVAFRFYYADGVPSE